VRGAIGAFLDITDVRRIEDELRQANAVKDEFLGLVSHELKTPITTILGNAEVLRKRAALLDEADRVIALTDIQDEASRLQNIIDNMLVLARLETAQRIDLEPVLIHRLVLNVADRHMQRNPHRTVHVRYDDALPPVIGSSTYVEQVVANLLSNAEKYSSMQAPIDIGVARDGARMVVTVSDRGVGVPPNELERVFTPFYRSPGAANYAQGFGIGLAVCKRLIEVQHGRIWAEACPDGGTCFSFELPIAGDEPPDS
jgi:signal transduction histidine kinase